MDDLLREAEMESCMTCNKKERARCCLVWRDETKASVRFEEEKMEVARLKP